MFFHLWSQQTGAEEALGGEPDADLKEKFVKVRNQLWIYQGRENDILNRENDVLEKEEATKQVCSSSSHN